MSTHRDFADAPSARRPFSTTKSSRSFKSRQRRRYKSDRKRLRARVRRRRRHDDYQCLLRLLGSMQRFETFKRLFHLRADAVPLSCRTSPLLPAIYPLVRNARDCRELGFVLYEELRYRFPLLDVYSKWWCESELKFEISYRSTDIYAARRGSDYRIPHDQETQFFLERLEALRQVT